MATLKALVVWWGGWGWYQQWGWWGAGWLLYDAVLWVTAQAYSITIGWGWGWGTSASTAWTSGQNSIFSTLTSIWWGWGWGILSGNWLNGGSGWWAWISGSSWWTWTSGQGYAGWNFNSNWAGAGWGWASVIWASTSGAFPNNIPWNGGNGTSNSISGSSITYAGWGWGWQYYTDNYPAWTGGTGGWWNWGKTAVGSAGTNWLWGGWGWGWQSTTLFNGWAGWSGIVIISYATNGSDWVSTSSTWWTITTSGTQTIHKFTTSGTFTMVASASSNNNFFMFFNN